LAVTWCGACIAPGAKYMKKGFSGATDLENFMRAMARSVMSVMK
jgi:hypothetical protein